MMNNQAHLILPQNKIIFSKLLQNDITSLLNFVLHTLIYLINN